MNHHCHPAGAGACRSYSSPQLPLLQLVLLPQQLGSSLGPPATAVLVLLFLATALDCSSGATILGDSVLGG